MDWRIIVSILDPCNFKNHYPLNSSLLINERFQVLSCLGYWAHWLAHWRTGCFKAFGMESFHIPDSQITASSYKQYFEPAQARLHMTAGATGNGAWCAANNYQQGEWLQVSSDK